MLVVGLDRWAWTVTDSKWYQSPTPDTGRCASEEVEPQRD